MAEVCAGDDGHAVQHAFALDEGRQGVLIHVGSPLELPKHDATHALEASLVNERLQLPVEVEGANLFSPRILVGGLQDRERFPCSVAVLPGDGFEVLLGHSDLAQAAGQSELLDQR